MREERKAVFNPRRRLFWCRSTSYGVTTGTLFMGTLFMRSCEIGALHGGFWPGAQTDVSAPD